MSTTKDFIREQAEADLEAFIKLVAPHRVIPHIHSDVIRWMTRSEAKSHQLVLLPRDHAKSTLIAYRAAWEIVKDPAIRILYISATAALAEKQLGLIKMILESEIVRRYWPDLVNEDEGKREIWTKTEIAVDHPKRKAEVIRDPTVFTGGLTTSLTGFHCDVAILDDVVVQENAYTEEGRIKVQSQYSLLASIESADAREWVVGTRYHPKDLYNDLMQMEEEVTDVDGNILDSESVYEVFQSVVETDGEFLWPRQQRISDGKWFGFNAKVLAKKKAQYLDKTQFFAQYYNNPNQYEDQAITPELFQYYDRTLLKQRNGHWYFADKQLSIAAAMDFAYTLGRSADFSAIAIVGMDYDGNIYILDIDRFKTDQISVMWDHLRTLFSKWSFRKIRMEMTAAQTTIVNELKEQYIKKNGISLAIDEFYPGKRHGDKTERMMAVLAPRYQNKAIWHYRGGHCQTLEEELLMLFPPHDDVMDAVTNAVAIVKAPLKRRSDSNVVELRTRSNRFGGY